MADDNPTILSVKRSTGVAGQVAYDVTVQYPGEEPDSVGFLGSVYGGPVVMVTPAGQVYVTDPSRFGKFTAETWPRRFFGEQS